MWIVKQIYEADYGCEERMPGEPSTVLVTLVSDGGEELQIEVADQWLYFMKIDEGDEWPEDLIDEEAKQLNKSEKQFEWMENYLDAVDEISYN